MSLDEAFLDLTDYLNDRRSLTAAQVVTLIRTEIQEATQLTASAGIACNTRLAKVKSNAIKNLLSCVRI